MNLLHSRLTDMENKLMVIPCIGKWILYHRATRETLIMYLDLED